MLSADPCGHYLLANELGRTLVVTSNLRSVRLLCKLAASTCRAEFSASNAMLRSATARNLTAVEGCTRSRSFHGTRPRGFHVCRPVGATDSAGARASGRPRHEWGPARDVVCDPACDVVDQTRGCRSFR